MPIIATNNGGDEITKLSPGSYNAICVGVFDLGKCDVSWKGEKKTQHKIYIAWEVDERIQDDGAYKGKRYVVGKRYTLSTHKKSALRRDLESWRGKSLSIEEERAFDVERVKGARCTLSVVHSENGYVNVSGIGKSMKGNKMSIETIVSTIQTLLKNVQCQ